MPSVSPGDETTPPGAVPAGAPAPGGGTVPGAPAPQPLPSEAPGGVPIPAAAPAVAEGGGEPDKIDMSLAVVAFLVTVGCVVVLKVL